MKRKSPSFLGEAIVEQADFVYFFTDTISHCTYYQLINAVRERGIPFVYIHGINLERNIMQICHEQQKRGQD